MQVKGKPAASAIAIEELPALLAGGRTLAGLDLGDKTIGVAVSDRGFSFAHPRPVIMRKKFSPTRQRWSPPCSQGRRGAVVIGLPVNMDGSEGPRAQASRAFVRNMARLTDLPFVFWDERLSTVAAERTLIEMDVSRAKRADADRFGGCRLHPAGRARPASGAGLQARRSVGSYARRWLDRVRRSARVATAQARARAGAGTPRSRRMNSRSKTQACATIGGMVAGSMPSDLAV